MKETEQLINEYVEHRCSLMHEDTTIFTLEREIRARRIRVARFKAMVDKEKENLRSVLNNAQRKEVDQQVINRILVNAGVVIDEMELRAKIGDGSWLLEPAEPADVLFDFGPYEKPNVAITYPWENRPAVIINIVKSVQLDPNNLNNPFILAAIQRYWSRLASHNVSRTKTRLVSADEQVIDLTPLEAERKLKRILGAVIEGANLQRKGRTRHQSEIESYSDWLYSDFDDAYFELLSTILKENETKRWERHKTNWKSRIGIRLQDFKPNLDHQPVLKFLGACTLPKHRTGRSLRNAFFAWSREIKSRTFSKYKSQGLKWKQERTAEFTSKYDLNDLDKALDAIATQEGDRLLLYLGFGKVDSYFDVRSSNLVWEEGLPSGNAPSKPCQGKPSRIPREQIQQDERLNV